MPADIRRVSTGSPFERDIAYARAVACDGRVYVAGTTGYDYPTMTMPDEIAQQCENALLTIRTALRELGSDLDQALKVTYILPDPQLWPQCWPVLRRYFGDAPPAATMISAGLQEREMKIEIELIARCSAP